MLYELISRIATIIVEELQFTKSNQSSFNLLRAIRVYNSWQANEGDKSGQEKVKGLTDELVTAIEQKLVKLKVKRTVTATYSDADVETASTPLAITQVDLCSNSKEWWKKMDLTLHFLKYQKDLCLLLFI